jgi:plastocyanin
MSAVVRIVLVLCAIVTGVEPAHSVQGAPLRGAVEAKKLAVTIDQYVCGKEKIADDLVVGAQRGLRNAVVWLQTPPAGVSAEAAPAKVEMDQKACAFVPRVVLVPAGGTVEFLNSDRLLHNVHSVSRENPSFNRTQPRGRVIPVTFAKPEIVRINCDLHSWMRGWVVVADHPFYALSNEAGEFELPPVPAGKYTLQIWHETLGISSRDVTVGPEGARITVDLKAKP